MPNTVNLTLPMPVPGIYGAANFTVVAPTLVTLTSTGGASASITNITLPKPTLTAWAGGDVIGAIPMATVTATGTVTGSASFVDTVPAATLVASGTVSTMAQINATMPMSTLVGYSGSVISVSIGAAALASGATAGGVGLMYATLPMFDLVATGKAQNHGGANLLMPMPVATPRGLAWITTPAATLVASGSAVVAVTYEAYALNLNHRGRGDQQVDAAKFVDELTRYTNYPFDSIVRYQNSYFGVNSTGLYLLGGTTDNGVDIAYGVQTHMSDFGTAAQKTVESAVFGGRLGPAETVTLYVGETDTQANSFTTPRGSVAQNYRQQFGRGNKTRYYAVGLDGTKPMAVDSIDLDIGNMKRRI